MQLDQLKRREFITLLGGAMAWPRTSRAQSSNRMRLVGGLFGLAESDLEAQTRVVAFRDQLAELGWVDGYKIHFEFRFFGSDLNAGRMFATELIRLAPNVIWTQSVSALDAIWHATRTSRLSVCVSRASVYAPPSSRGAPDARRRSGECVGQCAFSPVPFWPCPDPR
jgi:hypothetical protein